MQSAPKKNKCIMKVSALLSTLLLLITGPIVYSYFGDSKEESDPLLVALTLIMNLCGSLYCLISVAAKDFALYKKLRFGIYAALTVFTASIVTYCIVIISRGKNYDDLVCLIISYVILLMAYIFAIRLYDTEQDVPLLAKVEKSGVDSPKVESSGIIETVVPIENKVVIEAEVSAT